MLLSNIYKNIKCIKYEYIINDCTVNMLCCKENVHLHFSMYAYLFLFISI